MDSFPNEILLKIVETLHRKDVYRRFILLNKRFLSIVQANASKLKWPLLEFCYVGQSNRHGNVFIRIDDDQPSLKITDERVFKRLQHSRIKFLIIDIDSNHESTLELIDLFSRSKPTVREVVLSVSPMHFSMFDNLLRLLDYSRISYFNNFKWISFPKTLHIDRDSLVTCTLEASSFPAKFFNADHILNIIEMVKAGQILTNHEYGIPLCFRLSIYWGIVLKETLEETSGWSQINFCQTRRKINFNMKKEFDGSSVRIELRPHANCYYCVIFVISSRKRVLSYLLLNDVIRKAEVWVA
ncbi:unnamed protein product, partial [Mesorhabditis belari]|uniref:F-box domain-containing protein n=1 Tax=Mesorhabditis belari TaxID=2138241 RepID=A0AAF3FL70_9BILA